jgi:hypothetical protein
MQLSNLGARDTVQVIQSFRQSALAAPKRSELYRAAQNKASWRKHCKPFIDNFRTHNPNTLAEINCKPDPFLGLSNIRLINTTHSSDKLSKARVEYITHLFSHLTAATRKVEQSSGYSCKAHFVTDLLHLMGSMPLNTLEKRLVMSYIDHSIKVTFDEQFPVSYIKELIQASEAKGGVLGSNESQTNETEMLLTHAYSQLSLFTFSLLICLPALGLSEHEPMVLHMLDKYSEAMSLYKGYPVSIKNYANAFLSSLAPNLGYVEKKNGKRSIDTYKNSQIQIILDQMQILRKQHKIWDQLIRCALQAKWETRNVRKEGNKAVLYQEAFFQMCGKPGLYSGLIYDYLEKALYEHKKRSTVFLKLKKYISKFRPLALYLPY